MFDSASLVSFAAFDISTLLPWIHVANVLYLASYSVRDILWLRILTVIAALCLLPYYFSCSANPLWEAIAWNALFITVNLFQIFLLVKERWPVALQGLERQVYDEVFHDLTPGAFVNLLKLGEWREPAEGDVLVEHGTVVDEMLLLCEGEAAVRKQEHELARLSPGHFVGEMSFLTKEKASADVVCTTPSKVLSWPQASLQAFLDRNSTLSFQVRGVLGRDLVRKLNVHAVPATGVADA